MFYQVLSARLLNYTKSTLQVDSDKILKRGRFGQDTISLAVRSYKRENVHAMKNIYEQSIFKSLFY